MCSAFRVCLPQLRASWFQAAHRLASIRLVAQILVGLSLGWPPAAAMADDISKPQMLVSRDDGAQSEGDPEFVVRGGVVHGVVTHSGEATRAGVEPQGGVAQGGATGGGVATQRALALAGEWVPSPVTPGCILRAARMQGIPPHIILGLLKTEGGHLGSESVNRDGSIDLGPMQINDRTWVPTLARAHFGGDKRLAYIMLRDHGCYSVFIGAWIFSQYLLEAHGNYADAVGFYNSHSARQKEAYERRFAMNFKQLFGWMVSTQNKAGE